MPVGLDTRILGFFLASLNELLSSEKFPSLFINLKSGTTIPCRWHQEGVGKQNLSRQKLTFTLLPHILEPSSSLVASSASLGSSIRTKAKPVQMS